MRALDLCRAAAILGSLAIVAGPLADADAAKKKKPSKKKKDDDVVDVSAWKDKFVVYTDGDGGYFAVVPGETDAVFWGDGKTMYKQRAFGMSRLPPIWSFRVWSPRVDHVADLRGSDDATEKHATLSCGTDDFELTRVAAADATKIVSKAVFKAPLWKRQAHSLARDDRGTYYYVDRLRDEYGKPDKRGWRLFAGLKGAMKEQPLTNIVSDSEGELFSSKRGELRFVTGEKGAAWIKGDKRTELTIVPVERNVPMIYSELGAYEGSLGTPCDEY
jgi:hypothetical protein